MDGETETSLKEKHMDPSIVFTKSVMDQIQKGDVLSMVEAQREMLTRFEKTNEMLLNFNMLSSGRYETTMLEFKQHTNLLYDMKKDLDAIFRRIRVLKERLSSSHPEAFKACGDVYYVPEDSEGNVEDKMETTAVEEENKEMPETDKVAASSDQTLPEEAELAQTIAQLSTKAEDIPEQ